MRIGGNLFVSILIALLGWVSFFDNEAQAQQGSSERLILENAERLSSRLVSGQVVRMLEGHVRFRQGQAVLTCDRTTQYTAEQRTVFEGNVLVQDGDRFLRARRIVYLAPQRVYQARDSVVYRKGPSILWADELTYFQDERRVVARGNVRAQQEDERLLLTAERGEYFRDREYIRVTENPVLVQLDSLGREETRIVGMVMESFDGGRLVRVSDDVRIYHGELEARCQVAEYHRDSDTFVLLQNPVAWQAKSELRGDTLELHFRDRQVREVHVLSNATAISPPDSTLKTAQPNMLSGQKMVFYLQNQAIYRIVVEGTATSIYNMVENGKYQGVNWVQGDRIELFVKDNLVERAIIESRPGRSTGKFLPPGFQLTSNELEAVGRAADERITLRQTAGDKGEKKEP